MKHSTHIRRAVAVLLSACFLLACLPMAVSAEKENGEEETVLPICYQQNDPRWGDREQLAPGGCGILSLVNAVHFLTGNFINPVELAAYARSIDAYYGSVGGGTARWVLYHQLDEYEKTYGFDVVQTGKDAGAKHQTLIDHLSGGGTAVAHVKGHFIALCGYDAATDSMLVYDPAATPDRQTTVEPQWKTTDFLSTHPRMTVDWWCLIARTGDTVVTVEDCKEEGKNRELYVTSRCGRSEDTPLTLRGTVKSGQRLKSFFGVLDYDYDHILELDGTVSGGRSASFTVSVDTSEWTLGQHTLRLSARTENGGVVDIAEYSVFVSDGKDGYDAATGTLILNMSGFYGQKGVVSDAKVLQFDGYAFRAHPDDVLYLGRMDLSRYTAVRFYYSVRETFFKGETVPIGLRSSASSFGSNIGAIETTDAVVMEDLPMVDFPLSVTQTVTIDLTRCDYSGDLWFSVYHPKRQFFYLREIRFYTGDVPAVSEPMTALVTEPATEPATSPESPTEETEPAPAGGCTSVLPMGILPLTLATGAAAILSDRFKGKKRRF